MDDINFKKLETLIEALTHSGSNVLEEDIFKQVKKICKSSQSYILHTYNTLLKQLKKNNSQIRFIAFLICKELFIRSVLFRENFIKDLRLIFELTAEVNPTKKLPLPKSSGDSLKVLAISSLKKWVEEYGDSYKELKVAYNYLVKCKKVDFERLEVRTSAEQVAATEQQRHMREVNNVKIRKLLDEFNGNEPEIQMTITSLSNCLSLLLPTPEEFFISENNLQEVDVQQKNISTENHEDSESDYDLLGNKNDLREFGISSNYSLSLNLNPEETFKIKITDENVSVIENAKDCVRLINNRLLPMVKKWAKSYCKYSEGNGYEIKKIIDLKEQLEKVLKKYHSLNIEEKKDAPESGSSSEDEFEEVKKEGYEDSVNFSEDDLIQMHIGIKRKDKPCSNKSSSSRSIGSESKESEKVDIYAPSTSGTSCSTNQEPDRKKKLLAVAPKLPFDVDLYHWEDEDLAPPTLISTKIDVDKFWGCAGSEDIHEIPNPEGVAALRTRVIEFTGKFEPVKWSCRAPLSNGKTCPRKDRFKCPFHGKIVPRDETGRCQNEEEEEEERAMEQANTEADRSEWQDPELLKEIKAATGIDLKMPVGKKKRKKLVTDNLTHKKMKTSTAALRIMESKKLPGLVDVIKKQNNAYTRLCKKIFHRSSVKRVSSVLDKLDRKKFHDKFGDQFNYS